METVKISDPIYLQFISNFDVEFNDQLKRGQIPQYQQVTQRAWSKSNLDDFEMPQEWAQNANTRAIDILLPPCLMEYIGNPQIRELILHDNGNIHVDGPNGLEAIKIDLSLLAFELFTESMAVRAGQAWNLTNPFVSFRFNLANQPFRITLLHPEISPYKNRKCSMRRINIVAPELSSYCRSKDLEILLEEMIDKKKSFLIAGPTGSGKTTLLSSLMQRISSQEHLIILEDTEELVLPHPFCTRMLGNAGSGPYGLLSYQSYALRMRPDRMTVGELRGAETVPFILALNNGAKGLMATLHANSAAQGLDRLGLLFALYKQGEDLSRNVLLEMAAQSLDYVIYIENRKIKEIILPIGAENGKIYYETVYQLIEEDRIRQ